MSNMSTKSKKVASFKNFRGIDKESKASKVAIFRASEGKNFIIDHDVLKTRPSFDYQDILPELSVDETIVGWHEYRDIVIYVSNMAIYVHNRTTETFHNLTHGATDSYVVSDIVAPMDNGDHRPIFQDEKECVFIFGLGSIFVFSIIYDEYQALKSYVLYDIREKPSNGYVSGTAEYNAFSELPVPYIPTVMIGDETFSDVNMLSPVTKYKLFANQTSEDGKIRLSLPTHYDPQKHGEFSEDITFYDDLLGDYGVYPVFLGISDEDFESGDLVSYGTLLNVADPIAIHTTFFPVEDFEKDNGTPENIIKQIYRMNRMWFFSSIIMESGNEIDTFTYISNYIKNNASAYTENKTLVFTVPVKYNAIVRDETTNFIVEVKQEESTVDVYVQLKKYENSADIYSNNIVYDGEFLENEQVIPFTPVIDLPIGTPTAAGESSLNSQGHSFTSVQKFRWVEVDEILPGATAGDPATAPTAAGQEMKHEVVDFWAYVGLLETSFSSVYVIPQPQKSSEQCIDWLNANEPATDPSLNEGDLARHEVYAGQTFHAKFEVREYRYYESEEYFVWELDSSEFDVVEEISDVIDNGTVIPGPDDFTIKSHLYLNSLTSPSFVDDDVIRVTGCMKYYDVNEEKTYYRIYTLFTTYQESERAPVQDNLYTFDFNARENAFDLVIQDYFFDYKNKPSINVKVTFAINEDFDKIAKSRIGTTFGSENRLFLAGHPDYPNIDRYNVSNDLLGDNVKSQSYELAYFPSMNYRVLGGRGAINGYVVATDSHLYVTKEQYGKESVLFIRERILDEHGVVGYREYKTSIQRPPLNERCIVRFNNDILVLTKDGLFGIELSSNVLTDERLMKNRCRLVETELKTAIADSNYDVFMLENNEYLYIVCSEKVFVVDTNYVDQETGSYEFAIWVLPFILGDADFLDKKPYFLNYDKRHMYSLGSSSYDVHALNVPDGIFGYASPTGHIYFSLVGVLNTIILDEPEKFSFVFTETGILKTNALIDIDYEVDDDVLTVLNPSAFRDIFDGMEIILCPSGGSQPWIVSGFNDTERLSFPLPTGVIPLSIRMDIKDIPLYPQVILNADEGIYFRLGIYRPDEIEMFEGDDFDTLSGMADTHETFDEHSDFYSVFSEAYPKDIIIYEETLIELEWKSLVTDFGNSIMEKTAFRAVLSVLRLSEYNRLYFGRRTMRNADWVADLETSIANPTDFGMVSFPDFGLSSFRESNLSFPLKENNFAYIQFMIIAYGQIELAGFDIIYKVNRPIKSVG